MARAAGALVVVVVMACAVPSWADAQEAAPRLPALTWGGDVTASVSRSDAGGFFNYTSYEQDTLRLARVRLFIEARLPARMALLAEARGENDTAELPAAFLRWQPSGRLPVFVQAGRIPLVIGAFSRRAYGRENFGVGLPLAYQYLTSLRPDALPAAADDVLRMRGRGWLSNFPIGNTLPSAGIPLIALVTADTGVQVHWAGSVWSATAALTVGVPSEPRVRENNHGPAVSARVARTWPAGAVVGVSAARGPWVNRDVTGVGAGSTTQSLLGVDAEWARGRWILRGEWWQSTYDVPTLTPSLIARTGFVEARFRWRPRWQVAARVDRLTFSSLEGVDRTLPWDAPVSRVEGVLGYRVTRRIELRAGWQHNWRDGGRLRSRGFPTAQALLWF